MVDILHKLNPVDNIIICEVIDNKESSLITVIRDEEKKRNEAGFAKVLAVGKGKYSKKGKFVKNIDVKVGDVIIFPPNTVFIEKQIEGKRILFLEPPNVLAVLEN